MWTPTKNKKFGVVIYNYDGNCKYGLALEIGETVQILEECGGGWFRGYSTRKKSIKGIFPASVVCLRAFHIINEGLFETVVPVEDPTVREVTCVLREWHTIWKKLFIKHEIQLFQRLQKVMRDLIEMRRQLIIGTLTQDQMNERKARITAKIDWGNRYLGLDLVPRVDNEVVEPDSLSPVELYKVHLESAESVTGPLGRGTVKKKDPQAGIVTHHIFIRMRDFIYVLGEEVELHFSLYDTQQAEFISERYLVRLSKFGQSNFVEKLNSHCTIFTDLGNADLTRDIYIVVHIIRIGRMLNDSKKSTSQSYRRPYGCAVLNITEVLSEKSDSMMAEEREYTMKIHMCNENDFHQLHELIIKKQNNKYNLLSGQPNYGLVLGIRMLHGDLNQLCQESPLLFKNVSITRKRGFSDVIMPGDVRNDLYFALERGDFEKGGKSTGKNIEASVYLLNFDGQLLEKCISIGSGQENVSDYQSLVLYHNNAPRWSDLIKLAIPIEKFDGAHVRIEYRHCSTRDREKKLLGFSCIHLMDSKGTILSNGVHELYVYKCEDRSKLQDPKNYLNLPSGPKEGSTVVTPGSSSVNQSLSATLSSLGLFPRSSRETVYIRTLLCSTKLTQNGDVLSLLKWKDHPDHIQDTLNKVMKLDGEEIVKFLQDILDSLFSMFSTSDGNSTTHSGLVFKVLVHIFSLLEGSRYEHFKPVMDTYITAHFAAALVYKGLISCVKHCADLVRDTEQQESIHKCFLSLEYIFKFIIQSRVLFARATGDQNEEAFRLDLHELFHSFNRMLTLPSEPLPSDNSTSILANQVALVNSLGPLFEQLLKVMTHSEVTRIIKMTLEGLSYSTMSGGGNINISDQIVPQLATAKLKCILHLIKGPVFREATSRSELMEIIVTHLQLHLVPNKPDMAHCAEIIGEIITFLQHLKDGKDHLRCKPVRRNSSATAGQLSHFKEKPITNIAGINRDLDILVMGLVETLLDCVKQVDRTSSTAGLIVACLIGLLRLMEQQHYCHLWEKFTDAKYRREPGKANQQSLSDFLLLVFNVFREMVREDVFPPDWMVMRMVDNHVILCSLQEFSQPLTTDFLDGNAFNKQLWSSFFMLSVAFLTQPALQMETFSEAKRDKISEKYGDMRVLMGFQILSMWDKLGENKAHFIPAMVGPFLEVTLVPESELRKATLPIFFDMMDSEQRASGSFKQVESELIDKLDILISENKGDDEYRQLFNTILLERVRTSDPIWKENGIAFINSITRLLERLLDYRNVMEGEENQDKRMSCTVNLLNFYKNEINRKEMYIRYIYKLCDLHLPAENYTEASFTLKLHADLLSWSNNALPADQRYPQQPEWKRKESLYLKIIEYFDKGKCWEEGIELCKELANLYERQLFNYSKLSSILKTQARFFDNILTQLRPEPEYFRVGFYGLSFPLFLRNKVFVYRGLEYERIGAFTQRLQTEFPHAQILMKNTPPDDSIVNSDNQYIQICNVKPIPVLRPEFEAHDVPEKILSYYLVNEVNTFLFDRPIHKGPVDKDNEFKSLWIERTTLVTASHLPGILRWFEVIEKRTEELTPICHACESVQQMNKELRSLITQYTSDPRRSISPLSMRLQGVIEAAVNGGIAKYQEAFFHPDFALKNPEQSDKMARLKSLILEQVQILDGGLSLHGRLAPPDVQPLQRRLVDRFAIMKQSIREASSPNMAARLGNRRATTGDISTPSGGTHDVLNEPFIRRPSIVNTPLPPIPSGEILVVPKKLSPEPTGSTRSSSSGSSSIYGHFLPEVSDDEDIYSRPQTDYSDGTISFGIGTVRTGIPQQFPTVGRVQPLGVSTPPPLPTRPRSVALSSSPQDGRIGSYRTTSVRIQSSHHVEHQAMDDGYASLPSNVRLGPQHAPPPLPPPPLRSCLSPRPAATPVDTLLGISVATTPGSVCESLFSPVSCHPPSHPPPLALPPSLISNNGGQAMSRMSWSEPSYNIAVDNESSPPPLPPRGSEKKSQNNYVEENKPALPRRLMKKASAPALITSPQDTVLLPVEIEDPVSPTPPGNYSIPANSEQQQLSSIPPPLPSKKMSASNAASGAVSPSTPNCTPNHSPTTTTMPTSTNFDILETNDLNSVEINESTEA